MIVYCTTNLINGKKYIGKDVRNSPSYLGSGIAFINALKKYGKENFKKEILAYCETKEQLKELEEYYIDYYGARNSPLFYNIAKGGDGGIVWKEDKCHGCHKIYEIDINSKSVIKEFSSGKDASKYYNIPYKNVNAVLNQNKKSVCGRVFVKDKDNIDWEFYTIIDKRFMYLYKDLIFYDKEQLYNYIKPNLTLNSFKQMFKKYSDKLGIQKLKNKYVIK